MNSIVLDPYILAYPREIDDSTKFEEYVDRMLDIKKISEINNLQLLISKNTAEILFTENNYPSWDNLKKTLDEVGLSMFIQPRDIMSIIEGLLKLTEIEEFIEIEETLFEQLEYDSTILGGRNQTYTGEFERLLVLCLLNIKINDKRNHLLASVKDLSFEAKGRVIEIESSSNIFMALPDELSGEIITFSNLSNLFEVLDPVNLWSQSITKEDYVNSLNIYLYQRNGNVPDNVDWDFGDVFFDKARASGFLHEIPKIKMLLKSLADTILGENLPATHALRTDGGGNSPQVTRGGEDKAWRRDIDYEYHMHYWQARQKIEFASLGVHNDMRIPR